MADKYCCFLHPKKDHSLKELSDCCPDCGRKYGFPLEKIPSKIKDLQILKPAGRGFYGVTYKAKTGPFDEFRAVKVIPCAIYELFGKDFVKECKEHRGVAANTEHLVKISDYFNADVDFGECSIACHVAVMDWIEGKTLHEILNASAAIQATHIAQIGLDLLSLLDELRRHKMRHNDLHDKNVIIEENPEAPNRTDRVHSDIRAIAVDFGSLLDASLSSDVRLGDMAHVGKHIQALTQKILASPASESDLNWRLAFALAQTARTLEREPISQRVDFRDLRNEIASLAVRRSRTPVWKSALELKSFSEHLNALTIESAYVPNLLVLPSQSSWLDSVKAPGPQVISGMRGCGKTMLLKSLDFHARVFCEENQNADDVIARLRKDRFVGLFLACAKLLDQSTGNPANLHARLLVGYALSVLRVSQNLRDLKADIVDPRFSEYISSTLAQCLATSEGLAGVVSEHKLEEMLVKTQLRLGRENFVTLNASPATVFPIFGRVLERISPAAFQGAHVLFLLDDVSTRFISEDTISELISSLLFSNEACSFKFTTEAQTLQLALKSPGKIEKARQGRDYTVFNLGAEVSRLIRGKGKDAKAFICEILSRRRRFYPRHPDIDPGTVLGDQRLSEIAKSIGQSFENSERRKQTYWGISALTRLCVGDVGEIIRLYEDILQQATPGQYPVAPEIQHKCFQHICTSALHDLNRRNTKFKNHALAFANAAHKLLRRSFNKKGTQPPRIRQYAQVYVSISTGNKEWIYGEIRDLIDAGIYVLDAAASAPRTKRISSDPVQQFILTYRKLYGLSTLVGLSYRDRFELSGQDLEAWLKDPDKAEEILLRNEGGGDEDSPEHANGEDEDVGSDEGPVASQREESKTKELATAGPQQIQLDLSCNSEPQHPIVGTDLGAEKPDIAASLGVQIERIPLEQSAGSDLLIAAFGFEERCEKSLERLLETDRPKRALFVEFPEVGRTEAIRKMFVDYGVPIEVWKSDGVNEWMISDGIENVLVDVSGLAKPAIFHFCQHVLESRGILKVCHTHAEKYYPSEEDIDPVITARDEDNVAQLLEGAGSLFKGEEKPYKSISLLPGNYDDSRPRALLAFSSAKHERLLELMDQRFYEYVGIAYSSTQNGRGRVSELAARFAVRNTNGAVCYGVSPTDLAQNLQFLSKLYYGLYYESGYNVEIGLTGSKLSAVASAVLAARWKIAQAWYVKPDSFSTERFTSGTGESSLYEIRMRK